MKQTDIPALLLRYGPAALMTALVPALSLLPARFFAPIGQPLPPIPAFDKLVHALLYAALTAAWLRARPPAQRQRLRAALETALAAAVFGLLLEVAQKTLTATRAMDPLDALANAAGALACALAAFALARRRPAPTP